MSRKLAHVRLLLALLVVFGIGLGAFGPHALAEEPDEQTPPVETQDQAEPPADASPDPSPATEEDATPPPATESVDPGETDPTPASDAVCPDPTDADGDALADACQAAPEGDESTAATEPVVAAEVLDADGDAVEDGVDNCPTVANADQGDVDQDGQGDACGPEFGALAIVTVDAAGNPVSETCYGIYPDLGGGVPGDSGLGNCSGGGNLTLFYGTGSTAYVLVQDPPPPGYLPAPNRVVASEAGRTTIETVVVELGGTLLVKKQDAAGLPLTDSGTGACFDLYLDAGGGVPGDFVGSACDYQDGNDGTVTFVGLATADYVVVETHPPAGYLLATPVSVHVAAGQIAEQPVVDAAGGTLIVHKVDEAGVPLIGPSFEGVCFSVAGLAPDGSDNGFGFGTCDGYDGASDGDIVFTGLPTGDYRLSEITPPPGYLRAPDQIVPVVAGATAEVTVIDPSGGTVVVRKVNDAGELLVGACFQVYLALDGGARGEIVGELCDGYDDSIDGIARFVGLETGDYVLAEWIPPDGYLRAADVPFSAVAGKTTELTVVDALGGSLEIRTVDERGELIPGACFDLHLDAGGGVPGDYLGSQCDAFGPNNDGLIVWTGLETDDYVVVETQAPPGFLAGGPVAVHVDAGQTSELTVENQRLGTLLVFKVDENNDPLGGACFEVYEDLGGGTRGDWPVAGACDAFDVNDGTTALLGLTDGDYILVESWAPAGYLTAEDVPFRIKSGQTKKITVKDERPGSLVVRFVDETGAPFPGICFWLYEDPGDGSIGPSVAFSCDESDGGDDGATTFGGLREGPYLVYQARVPEGYATVNGQARVRFGRTTEVVLEAARIGEIVVRGVDDAGEIVTDGFAPCVRLHYDAGHGEPGDALWDSCDGYDGIADGTMTFTGVWPDSYVVVSTDAPDGYLLADNVAVAVESGGTATVELVHPRGGVLVVRRTDQDETVLPGGCFGLYTDAGDGLPGEAIETRCDGDQDPADGEVTFDGLDGSYVLVDAPPTGYLTAAYQTVRVRPGRVAEQTVANQVGGVLVIRKVDEAGLLVPGACFTLRGTAGGEANIHSRCDGFGDEDPDADGLVTFVGLDGEYQVIEEAAPLGYLPGADQTVTVLAGETRTISVVNRLGGAIVVHTENAAGERLPRTCLELYEAVDGGQRGELVTSVCDFEFPEDPFPGDGTTRILGLETGTYVLVQTAAPFGYLTGPDLIVAVTEGQTVERTIVVELGGTFVVLKRDEANEPLPGSCFGIYQDLGGTRGDFVTGACDYGNEFTSLPNDGTVEVIGLPTGDYWLVEGPAPPGYLRAADVPFSIVAGETRSQAIVDPLGGTLLVAVVDQGEPYLGACLWLFFAGDGGLAGFACDEADGIYDGTIAFIGLATGDYVLGPGSPSGPTVHVEAGETTSIQVDFFEL